jgi:ribosomal protein S18 acetylase RimI-like enzyme
MTLVRMRVLAETEWPIWRDLRIRALTDAPDAFGRTLEGALAMTDDDWRAHFSTDARTFIAEIDGTPVGGAVIRVEPDEPSIAGLFGMWVDPSVRRSGVAKALLEAAEASARAFGATEIELEVTAGNEAAQTFYRSAGFIETGRREPLRAGSQLTTAYMRRPVAR